MTTDGWSSGRGRVLTKLPTSGAVLVRSSVPPTMAVGTAVDVRPGPTAAFDGDRPHLPLQVTDGREVRRFGRDELPAIEAAVADLLEGDGSAAVRFGDREACRRVLPMASLDAIERRLLATVRRGEGTLVAWTAERPRDRSRYDAVIE